MQKNMNNKEIQRALEVTKKWNVFRPLIEAGLSPSEIKSSIIEILHPYFKNKALLAEYAVELLPGEAFRVARIQQDPWTEKVFNKLSDIYRLAEAADPGACYKACAESERDILAAASYHWSQLYLEIDKAELPLEEFRHEAFRNIGALIESYLFPHLTDLLVHVRIARGKKAEYSQISRLKLGNIVNELYRSICMPEIVAPPPWGIHLNQWRNIAQHHRTRVSGQMIYGYYGEAPNEREIKLTRDELLYVLQRIYSICEVANTTRTLFVIDNIKKIEINLPEDLILRKDAFILSLATTIATQGFELTDLQLTENLAVATISELTDAAPEGRRIHASQFVYPIWCKVQKEIVIVNYLDREGKKRLTTEAQGVDCKRIAEGEIAFSELANLVEFEIDGEKILRTNQVSDSRGKS
jgi:hypothetical protein